MRIVPVYEVVFENTMVIANNAMLKKVKVFAIINNAIMITMPIKYVLEKDNTYLFSNDYKELFDKIMNINIRGKSDCM